MKVHKQFVEYSAQCGISFWPDPKNRQWLADAWEAVTCKNCLRFR